MIDSSLPIGVFDSGVGGLTVAREILRNLPNEKIVYFGDTARVPYGNKSAETIIRYSKQIAKFLVSKQVKAIVIACNTASAFALDAVQAELDIPVIGVIEPGARAATNETRNNNIGVIGTKGTVSSGLYTKYITQINPDAKVFATACPLFVNLVEEGMIDDPVTVQMIHRYIDGMIKEHDIDSLILGCTHYPLLINVIAREIHGHRAGDGTAAQCGNISLVNPAYETALALKALLTEQNLLSDRSDAVTPEEHQYYVSDDTATFRRFASVLLEIEVPNVSLKALE